MKIAATQFSLLNKALEFYTAGCDGYCNRLNKEFIKSGIREAGCHNPELWDETIGIDCLDETFRENIKEKVKSFDSLIEYFFVLGGEPLIHDTVEVVEFLTFLKSLNKKIVLFTRFEISDIPIPILDVCEMIKTGPFDYSQRVDDYEKHGIKLASKNQEIITSENFYGDSDN